MANLRLVKRRIKSAKNIGQVTKALQMVSAVKMRKAQETAAASKPYATELRTVLHKLSGKSVTETHPFLQKRREINKVTVVVVAPEKGLAGSLITNLTKKVFAVADQIKEGQVEIGEPGGESKIDISKEAVTDAISWGTKARDIIRKTGLKLSADFSGKSKNTLAEQIEALDGMLAKSYLAEETDLVLIVYSDFVNTVTQKPTVAKFLPMTAIGPDGSEIQVGKSQVLTFEPTADAVLDSLLKHYLKTIMSQIILDSLAAEHSARMVAMKNAYDNSKDIIKYLTLTYNQSRQSAITNEIADIVSGSMISA
jgi:F-type H+-transporting ATPase subunit gamma